MHKLNPKHHQKMHKSTPIKGVISTSKAKAIKLRAEQTPARTAGTVANHSTTATVLLVSRTQHYMWTKLNKDRMAK